MPRFALPLAVIASLLVAGPSRAGDASAAFPNAVAFTDGSNMTWFSACTFEADRYISCKSAAPGVLAAIAEPGDQTAGGALQTYVSDLFIEKGCAFEAAPESFRVNGIFLSFDTRAAKDIRCAGKKSAIIFSPEGMTLLDTLYFFSAESPQ